MIGANPTLQPPQISPDGKWIWDGHSWQPLPETTWDPAAEAVIPEAVAVTAPTKSWVQPGPPEGHPRPAIARNPVANSPAARYPPASYPAADYPVVDPPVTPLWAEPAGSNRTIYMYAGTAAVLLVMLMMVLNSTNVIQLPWPGSASSAAGPTIQPSPTPKTSDYARADRFLNVFLLPALPSIGHTLPALESACTGTLSNGCLTALNTARQQMTDILSTIDHGDVPPCIAAGASATRFDLQSMAAGLDSSLNAYQDNSGAEIYQGINRFAYFGRSLKPDAAAINVQKAHCSKVLPS